MIDEQVEGVYYGDVHKAWRLWQDSGLSRAEFSKSVRWVGRKPIKLPGAYGRPPSTARINFSSAISSPKPHYGCRDKQPSVGPSNVETAATPHFHPKCPKLLNIGTSSEDGTKMWATFVGTKKQQLRYKNEMLEVVSVKDLDVVWLPQLELNVFQGKHKQEKERTRRQHIIKLIKENTADTPSSSDDTSRASTPTAMILRPRPSSRKRRQTSKGIAIELSKSDDLSESDSFPSPSRLLDLSEGRRLGMASGGEALPLLGASSVQTKRAPAYDVRPRKLKTTSRQAINHTTGARMDNHPTHDHTFDHATHDPPTNHTTNTRMTDHATYRHTVDHATGARVNDHATNSLIDHVEAGAVSYGRAIRTILRVSTSKKPAKAPINILLGNCKDVVEFYSKVLSQCTTSADEVYELSATFTWNGRGNRIRKDNYDDWSFFYEDLQSSWKRDVNKFINGTCEIEIILHMESELE